MKLVILESPFAGKGDTPEARKADEQANIEYARACLHDSLLRGEAPIASHLLYTQPGVLDDNIQVERNMGIEAGLAWRAVAEGSVIYIDRGVSSGMKYGAMAALKDKKEVLIRSIYGNAEACKDAHWELTAHWLNSLPEAAE